MNLYINWNPNPNAIDLGFMTIQWYGIMWALSIFSTYFMGQWLLKGMNRTDEKLTTIIQYIFIGGLLGARFAHVFFYDWDFFSAHPEYILMVWKGGLASHGGLVGGIIGLILFCKRNEDDFPLFWTMDHAAITVLFLASFIRLGNLMNSEIVGKPTDVPWAFVFTQYDSIPRHPVVLYESMVYFILQLVLIVLYHIYKQSKPGLYMAVFFTFVFGTRLIIEFLKEPEGGLYFNAISKTQLLNVPFIVTGIVLLLLVMQGKLRYKLPVLNTPPTKAT